ncbi:MAG: hypothetical protein ACRC0M_08880 [Legionella sp.]
MMQLQRAMTVLREHLKKSDLVAREHIILAIKLRHQIWYDRFVTDIVEVQKKQSCTITETLASVNTNDLIHQQKKDLLNNINRICRQIITMHRNLLFSSDSLKQELNGCMEHATLMFLILAKEFLFSPELLIESVYVCDKNDPMKNHNFLVINRNRTSDDIMNVTSWGSDCLIIDTWLGLIATPENMPIGSSIHAFLQGDTRCTMSVAFSNQMSMELATYPEGHLFHQIEHDTQQACKNEIKKIIDRFAAMLALPWLTEEKVEALPETRYGLFVMNSNEPHQQLLADINAINAKINAGIIKSIENKQYTLALRKASGIGQIELMRTLLNYKESLNIDINEPSPSSGKTALDWAVEHGQQHAKELLEQHGGLTRHTASNNTL